MGKKKGKKETKIGTQGKKTTKKKYVSQKNVPSSTLEQALRIPQAIFEHYGSEPTSPLDVATALNMQPTSGGLRALCGASRAYGLTLGAYNSTHISLTPLARRILEPQEEGDDLAAKREAFLQPTVISSFVAKYNNKPLPREDIANNVLATLGVPRERAKDVYSLILNSADSLGLVRDIKNKKYISSKPVESKDSIKKDDNGGDTYSESEDNGEIAVPKIEDVLAHGRDATTVSKDILNRKRVYVSHGKNQSFIGPIKKFLEFGELEPVVSIERASVSQPVPDKVMSDMRSCGAAIIHVDDEKRLIDPEGNTHIVLNPNVLIEIGAAIALYGRRFILLVKDDITMPSNLQGLFEVRYSGEGLDSEATMKLLDAINDIKNHELPDRYRKASAIVE